MNDLLHLVAPLFAFMLIPVWIPLISIVAGAAADLFRPQTEHPVLAERARKRAARAVPAGALVAQPA